MEKKQTKNIVALVSGGKDSVFNIIKCLEQGHILICIANLYPPSIFLFFGNSSFWLRIR